MATPCDSPRMSSLSGAPTLSPELFDLVGCEVRVLVLPDVDRDPAQFLEVAIDPAVALDIAVEFLPPPVAVCLRHGPVLGALVPEATIHEHDDLRRTEYQVRCSRQAPQIRPVPQPSGMKDAPKPEFGPRILAGHPLHLCRDLLAARFRAFGGAHAGIIA